MDGQPKKRSRCWTRYPEWPLTAHAYGAGIVSAWPGSRAASEAARAVIVASSDAAWVRFVELQVPARKRMPSFLKLDDPASLEITDEPTVLSSRASISCARRSHDLIVPQFNYDRREFLLVAMAGAFRAEF